MRGVVAVGDAVRMRGVVAVDGLRCMMASTPTPQNYFFATDSVLLAACIDRLACFLSIPHPAI